MEKLKIFARRIVNPSKMLWHLLWIPSSWVLFFAACTQVGEGLHNRKTPVLYPSDADSLWIDSTGTYIETRYSSVKDSIKREEASYFNGAKQGYWVFYDSLGNPLKVLLMFEGKKLYQLEKDSTGKWAGENGLGVLFSVDSKFWISEEENRLFFLPLYCPEWVGEVEICTEALNGENEKLCEKFIADGHGIFLNRAYSGDGKVVISYKAAYKDFSGKRIKEFEYFFMIEVVSKSQGGRGGPGSNGQGSK